MRNLFNKQEDVFERLEIFSKRPGGFSSVVVLMKTVCQSLLNKPDHY